MKSKGNALIQNMPLTQEWQNTVQSATIEKQGAGQGSDFNQIVKKISDNFLP